MNLLTKLKDLSWVAWAIDYAKENPVMAAIVGGITLLLLITALCIFARICGILHYRRKEKRKIKKVRKAEKLAAKQEEAQAPAAEVPVEATEESAPVEITEAPVVEKAAVEAPLPPPVEIPPVVEEKVESAPAPAPVPVEEPAPVLAEEMVPVEEAPEKPEKKARTSKKAADVDEVLAFAEGLDAQSDAEAADRYDESETDRIARYKGKWVVCRVLTDDEESEETYFFELRASNGEKLLSSEEYTTYQGALRGIQTHKTNILKGNLKVSVSKKGDYIFKLLNGKNMLLCMGENYPTQARCESAIDSTIRFAATAILDENIQDIVVKVPQEDDTPLPPLPENCNGKWIVSEGVNAEGVKIFYFELFANNGEKLLSSEEYTTSIGAINGIQTHKKNIDADNFRITLTKRGDYIYKLLNGNGQLLCLGEHYRTKRLCQNAVESVKRFAVSSPILTEK